MLTCLLLWVIMYKIVMPYVIVGICYRVLRNVEIWGNILYLAYPSFPTWVTVPNLIVQRVRRKYGLISYKHPPTLEALPCPVWLPYVERCLLHRGSRKVSWSRQLVIACRWPELTHWADWIWSLFGQTVRIYMRRTAGKIGPLACCLSMSLTVMKRNAHELALHGW